MSKKESFLDNMAFGPNNVPAREYVASKSITPIADEALRSPPSDEGERLGPNRAFGYLPDDPNTTCPYCGASAPLVNRVLRCVDCDAVIRLNLDEWPGAVKKLAHILWRNAKQLVSLLENEYGFGQKAQQPSAPYIGMNSEGAEKPWTVPRGHRAGTDFEPGMTMQEHDKVGSRHLIGYEAHDDIHKRNQQVTASGQVVTVTDEPHVVLRHSHREPRPKRGYEYKEGAKRNYFNDEEMKTLVNKFPEDK